MRTRSPHLLLLATGFALALAAAPVAGASSFSGRTVAPAAGAHVSGKIRWTVKFSLRPSAVVFRIDGVRVGLDRTPPWTRLVRTGPLGLGSHVLQAIGHRRRQTAKTAVTVHVVNPPPRFRFMYSSSEDGASGATVAKYGFNLMDAGSQWRADQAPAGTRALVWLGDYDNGSCGWQQSDATVRRVVQGAIGDPKVAGYFISDEPDPYACPAAPADHAARTALIHSIDPAKFVVIVMDSNSGSQSLNQIPLWKGAADRVGLDPYPCFSGRSPCDYARITAMIRAADAAGLNYWGVVQGFRDTSGWRWPTPTELQHMLAQWNASRETGMMTFAWTWDGFWLRDRPRLLDVFRAFNAHGA